MNLGSSKWILALPAVFCIHDLEELIFIDKIPALSSVLSGNIQDLIRVSKPQFAAAISLLFIVILIITIRWYRKPSSSTRGLFLGFIIVGLFFNSLTHIVQALLFRQYVPGLVSAVVLLLPYTFVILKSQYARFFPSNKTAVLVLLGVIASTPVIVIGSLLFGKLLFPV
jgi:hypothetical protein